MGGEQLGGGGKRDGVPRTAYIPTDQTSPSRLFRLTMAESKVVAEEQRECAYYVYRGGQSSKSTNQHRRAPPED